MVSSWCKCNFGLSFSMLGSSTYKSLEATKTQEKKYYQLVEGEESSFGSIDCKLSNEFFELFGDDNIEEYEDFEGFDIEDV